MPPQNYYINENQTHFLDVVYDMLTYSEYAYELTITLNPMIWTRQTSYRADTLIEDRLYQWLCPGYNPYHITSIIQAKEYQRNGMSHYHLAVCSDRELPPDYRSNIIRAIQANYGRTTFKDIIDKAAYTEYMYKDQVLNLETHGYKHYKIVLEIE